MCVCVCVCVCVGVCMCVDVNSDTHPPSQHDESGSDAASLPKSCDDCGRVQYITGKQDRKKLRLGPVPADYLLGHRMDRKKGRWWCDKCRGQYDRATTLRDMPVYIQQGMVMPVSREMQIVHQGVRTNPVVLLKLNEKYVKYRLNDKCFSAAVEVVSCTAASTLLTVGCAYTAEEATQIKKRARGGHIVYIRPVMDFFAVQTTNTKKIVRGKMAPVAVTFIREPADLDKNFQACAEVVNRFERDGRAIPEGQSQTGSAVEWAKAPAFFQKQRGRYHFLATAWADNAHRFTCRCIVNIMEWFSFFCRVM